MATPRKWTLVIGVVLWFLSSRLPASGEDLRAHWPLDELAGGVVKDATGHGHPGKVFGARQVPGVLGGALEFDGRDDYVVLGDFGSQERFTLAFWLKPDPSAAAKDEWQGLVSSDGPWEQGVLHVALRKGRVDVFLHAGEWGRVHLQTRVLAAGRWQHLALVGDTIQHTLRLFLNGEEETSDDLPREIPKVLLDHQVIGREFDNVPQRYYRGIIDDVRIYGQALDEGEIAALCPHAVSAQAADPRNLRRGHRIPDEGYSDQPYVVVTRDGNWLCLLTTGPGHEGDDGQHLVATRSPDHGRTWSKPVDIEPSGSRSASWVVPLVTPYGRVYAFYTYNGDDVHELRGKRVRADTIGWYAFKYSDDHGRTWSKRTYRLPLRVTGCDRTNDWQGKVQIFWGIDKPNVADGVALFAFTKLGKYMLDMGEGWLWRSDNILRERDVEKLHWELLPDGDRGLRVPQFGSVQEEHNVVPLSGRSLYCVYRTALGFPAHCYSRDGGHTWTTPEQMTYTPGGRGLKTPRACPMVWRTAGGMFLFWFHNNGSKVGFTGPTRNPVWITGGVEKDGCIHWSQPELLLYDPDASKGISYPDLIEQDGHYWITETQKSVARVHEVDRTLLEGLWTQGQTRSVARRGLLVEAGPDQLRSGRLDLPEGLALRQSGGMAIELWLTPRSLMPGQPLLDGRTPDGKGFAMVTSDSGSLRLELSDGQNRVAWACDPNLLKPGKLHHVVAVVDAGPRVVSFVVDGTLCDGGESRPYGWTRYACDLDDVRGSRVVRIAPAWDGAIRRLRIYGRYLRTSEAVASFRAGP